MLPELLLAAVRRELEGVSIRDLRAAAAMLSAAYRGAETERQAGDRVAGGRRGPLDAAGTVLRAAAGRAASRHLAYLVARLPATFAAVAAALDRLAEHLPAFAPASLIDLGTGPGTATWAAAQRFPSIERATLVERDARFAALAARLLAPLPLAAEVQCRAIGPAAAGTGADLVVLAYVIGELPPAAIGGAVDAAWSAAGGALVAVEPGTPGGHARLIAVRERLVAAGARIVAPCPHAAACPLTGRDWCHFGVRLARSREHRLVKSAELAWEDEKFAYLVAAREAGDPATARILRRPDLHKGHIGLSLCTTSGVEPLVVTRSNRDAYRLARRARWGDAWPPRDRGQS